MIKNLLSLFLLLSLLQNSSAQEQKLISFEKIQSFSKEDLKAYWKKNSIPKIIMKIKHPVDVYEVLYTTEWHDGSPIKASGLYVVPADMEEPMAAIIYNHGTSSRKARGEGVEGYFNGEGTIGLLYATDGYGVMLQDYVGLGNGDGIHLYHHARTEGQSGIDMYFAAKEINPQIGKKFNDLVFTTGYSQGGHAAMAVHKMAQEMYEDKFSIAGSSPMSGAYDLHNTQAIVMYEEYTQPHYLPYLIIGYNEAYQIYPKDELFNIFAPPYNASIPHMFQGKTSVGHINKELPSIPIKMFAEEMIYQFENNPDFEFKRRLQENSLYDWKPEAPVQFCYCKGDEEVLYKNSELAYKVMKAREAKHIYKRQLGKKRTHRQCADFAIVQTKFFFNSIRKGKERGRKGPAFKRMVVGLAKAFM